MKLLFLTFVLVISGCSTTSLQSPISYSDSIEVIRTAAESAPNGVEGLYTLKIKAVGSQGPYFYLNTELDYRDQRAVTVALHPSTIEQFTAKYGTSPQDYFVDKSIRVEGQAKRVRINFISQGKKTEKYYYQTHIRVTDVSQIEVINEST